MRRFGIILTVLIGVIFGDWAFGDERTIHYNNRGDISWTEVTTSSQAGYSFRGNAAIRTADWPSWKTDVCHYYFFKAERRVVVNRDCLFCHNRDRTLGVGQ